MLSINISELLLTILSFFVLMFLLNKLLFKPVISFREQRQNRMDESFRQESLAKEKQAQAREEAQRPRPGRNGRRPKSRSTRRPRRPWPRRQRTQRPCVPPAAGAWSSAATNWPGPWQTGSANERKNEKIQEGG